jgi:hypothetical protein
MSYVAPRPVSRAELEVLRATLTVAATSQISPLVMETMNDLTVYSRCDCGCASVGFLPEGHTPAAKPTLIGDGLGLSDSNGQVGVIVWGSPSQIVELEVHWPHAEGAPLPRPETIVPWERGNEVVEAAR